MNVYQQTSLNISFHVGCEPVFSWNSFLSFFLTAKQACTCVFCLLDSRGSLEKISWWSWLVKHAAPQDTGFVYASHLVIQHNEPGTRAFDVSAQGMVFYRKKKWLELYSFAATGKLLVSETYSKNNYNRSREGSANHAEARGVSRDYA